MDSVIFLSLFKVIVTSVSRLIFFVGLVSACVDNGITCRFFVIFNLFLLCRLFWK